MAEYPFLTGPESPQERPERPESYTGVIPAGKSGSGEAGGQSGPAERLRLAAALLEQRAAAATPGPWVRPRQDASFVSAELPADESSRYRDGIDGNGRRERVPVCSVQTWEGTGQFVRSRSGRDLDWITTMDPRLGPPLAELLRDEADLFGHWTPAPTRDIWPALAIADLILGGEGQ